MSELLDGNHAAKTVIRRLRFSVVVWIIIASFQILIGLPLILVGYGFSMIACGGWNIYASISRIKFINELKENPQMIYPYYSTRACLDHTLIFLGINLLFGGFIGVIASVYDLLIRHYVVTHAEELTIGLGMEDYYGEL